MSFLSSLYSLSLCAVTLPHFQPHWSGGLCVPWPHSGQLPPSFPTPGFTAGPPDPQPAWGSGGHGEVMAQRKPPEGRAGRSVGHGAPQASLRGWAPGAVLLSSEVLWHRVGLPASMQHSHWVVLLHAQRFYLIRCYRLVILIGRIYIFLLNET